MKSSYENIVIETSLDPVHLKRIQDLVNSPMIASAKNVHFVNIFNHEQAHYLPCNVNKKDFDEIENYVLDILRDTRDSVIPVGRNPKDFILHSFFSDHYKIKSKQYLKDINADLVITSTRGEEFSGGVLHCDSLSNYLVANSPCDVYVLTGEGHKNQGVAV